MQVWKKLCGALCITVLVAATVLAVFSSSPEASTAVAAASKTACVPPPPSTLPKDPDHVAAKLKGAARAALGGYAGAVYASPWVKFKPKHGPPWKIGMSNNEGNLNAQRVLVGLQQGAKANPGKVSKIVSVTPSTPNDVPTQIQQMRSLLQQKVDIIYSTLGSPTALNAVIEAAAKKNVPVISILGQATDKHAVNLQPNPIQLGYYGARTRYADGRRPARTCSSCRASQGCRSTPTSSRAVAGVLKACQRQVVHRHRHVRSDDRQVPGTDIPGTPPG